MTRSDKARSRWEQRPLLDPGKAPCVFSSLGSVLAWSCLVSAPLCLLLFLVPCHSEEEEGMPAFRRLFLPPERLPEELKRVQEGVLVRLPVAEFDALVKRAVQARTRKPPPQLLEARYHAMLKEDSLVGEGQWKLVHAGPGPGLLNLQPFNLALRQARFENGDALIAAFDGKTPALLVETPGERTVSLDWSARAEASPEGLQFHLEMPPCPVALVELDVPAGRAVSVLNDGALLSGPHEADVTDLRRWRIVCGGHQHVDRQRIDIRIHPIDRPDAGIDAPPVPFVHQKTTQKLSPEGLDATFELTLDSLSRGVRELICECDSELRPRDVIGPEVDGYAFQSGEGGQPARLTIRLRGPVRAGTWQVHCLAPLHNGTGGSRPIVWRSPGLRLINSVSRGETLTLWLHPDLRIESWSAGGFQLTSSDLDRATGAQVLTLLGGGSVGSPRRPAAQLQAYGVEFVTHQLTWWRCDAGGMALTVQIGWDVSQGQLFQLPVLLPVGWNVEKVELTPIALLRDWHLRKVGGNTTLFVNLSNPLEPSPRGKAELRNLKAELGSSASDWPRRLPTLTLYLRPAGPDPFTEKRLPFPDAVPLGARFREGALALDCDEQLFHLQVQTTAERTEPESEGPWGQKIPEYYYRYSGQPVTGEIRVRARPPRVRAKCTSTVLVVGGDAVIETHVVVEAEAGSPNTIDLWLSAGDGEAWQWRTEAPPRSDEAAVYRVRHTERVYVPEISSVLHLLAAPHPLQAAVVHAVRPTGERWRLTLARPLRLHEPLRLHAQRRLQPRDNRWDVPLPVVLGAERMEGEVVLHRTGSGLVPVHRVGLHESASSSESGTLPWRTFRYVQNEVRLILSSEMPPPERSEKPDNRSRETNVSPLGGMAAKARLITYAGRDDVLRHHFSFQIANWGERTLPLRLPPGSRLLAVQVDGHWLPQFISSSQSSPKDEEGPIELALPVPLRADAVSGDNGHYFEIVYTRLLPAGLLWRALDAPVPQLPIAPLAFHRIWRLTPQWMPLHPGRYQSLPGMIGAAQLALPRHTAELFQFPAAWTRFDPLREEQQANRRAALKQAIQELRDRHTDQKMSLREVVSEMSSLVPTLRLGMPRCPLIIDDLALREAGVKAETRLTIKQLSWTSETPVPLATMVATPVSSVPWVERELVAVLGRSALLLTTDHGRGALLHEPLSEEVENALDQAAQHGQDPSGRFRSAWSWLHPESLADSAEAGSWPLSSDYEGSEWSEWEPVAGGTEEQMLVVRREGMTVLGFALGWLCVLLYWLQRRWTERRLALLLSALSLFGLGVLWLPEALRDLAWWPLLASGAVAVLEYLNTLVQAPPGSQLRSRPSKSTASSAAIAGMVILGVLGWNGRAAAPLPATVYLIPASAETPGKQTVLVPVDLLNRLKALAQPPALAPGGPQTVLLDAVYEGRLVDEGKQVEFTAVFSAHSLSEGPSTLIVPLVGVGLVGEVLVDGARVAPLAAPQGGYSLPVRSRGRHKIELRFRAPVVGTLEDRNALFTVPPLVRSRLSWRVPDGAVEPQVLVKNGAQWMTYDDNGQSLEADLGAPPLPVHLHWYQPKRPLRVSYQAAYLWELGPAAHHLTAWLRYRVEQGAIKTLEVDLPAGLEVSSANAQRTVSLSRPSWRARFQLRDWHVSRAGNQRMLYLELPYPISGDFQVTLELLPRAPLTSPTALPLPTPRGVRAGGPHYLAYRTQPGLNAQRETSQNLTRIDTKEFASHWLGGPSLEANFQGIAYRIPPDRPPQLLLRLEPRPPVVQGEVEVVLRANRQRAEIEVVADVTAPNRDLAAIEWDLPPHCVLVTAVGEDVRTWKQNGSRLLVWLNRTTKKTRIHLSGWLSLSFRAGHPHLELNGPRLLHANKQHTRLRLAAANDLVLAALRTQNLQPVQPDSPANDRRPSAGKTEPGGRTEQPPDADRPPTFETQNLFYHLECQIQAAANAVARVLTLVEAADQELRFTATVDYTVTHGELRQVRLRLRNWEEEKVEVQAGHLALLPAPRRSMGERSWLLPLQPGVHGHYQVTLHSSMPLERAAGGIRMPEILVQGVERVEYFAAVVGSELTVQTQGPLRPLKSPRQTLQATWPEAAQRLEHPNGQAWRIGEGEWQVRLLPQVRLQHPTPVRTYLQEQWAAVEDGRRWLHEMRCWLRHETQADLTFRFAAPARVLAVAIDGVEVTPFQPSSTRVWVPLPGQAGVRCIRLRWLYDPPEPLERLNLAPPQLAGAEQGPILGTVMVPPGWQAHLEGASNWQGIAREAARALWHADAQLRICQDLAKERRNNALFSAWVAAQRRFAAYRRHAQQVLDFDPDVGQRTGPQGQSLADWLKALQAKGRLLKSEMRNLKPETDDGNSDLGLRVSDCEKALGIPVSWQTESGAESLTLQLRSQESQQMRQTIAASLYWLGALAIVWLLSLLPFLTARLYLFWPEQIALVGVMGWRLAGLTAVVGGLMFAAVGSRIFLLLRGLRTWGRKRRRQPSTQTADKGVGG